MGGWMGGEVLGRKKSRWEMEVGKMGEEGSARQRQSPRRRQSESEWAALCATNAILAAAHGL